ncbi:MAG: acylneuraminate cytidylyltransferase family protein [Butyrivibrio sp.]|nr:acylneuraminate cytidylyltransferase family protein [Butyrivibrio sp.]
MNIAVIPARSGSKGLKDKNIRGLGGKPLLAYSVEAALKTGLFDTVHVSTDSAEYADIAKGYGADVPFLRTGELSSDSATTWDAIKYVLEEYRRAGKDFDIVAVLQPTSPLRTADDITEAFRFFEEKNANMISSVCEMDHSPLWSNVLPKDLSMEDFEKEELAYMPRQTLPTYYRENGAIYILRTKHLYNSRNIYKNGCYAFIMDKKKSIDIDDEFDFMLVEAIFALNGEK